MPKIFRIHQWIDAENISNPPIRIHQWIDALDRRRWLWGDASAVDDCVFASNILVLKDDEWNRWME